MSIGRNDPCPCGSGKKYKKCCLTKSNSFPILGNFNYTETNSSYSFIDDAAHNIANVFSQYALNDVIRAIFCLNSWRPNRSALSQCYAMNKAIILCDSFGEKRIESYSQLFEFYNSLSNYNNMFASKNERIIDDFGEIYINYLGNTYPIITGTGHTQVYGVARLLPYICERLNKQTELLALLSYVKCIISNLAANNNVSQEDIAYELPSEEFWKSVNVLFNSDEFIKSLNESYTIIGENTKQIEKAHFIKKQSKIYPLWNPGLLVDYYHSLRPDESDFAKQAVLVNIFRMYNKFDYKSKSHIFIEPLFYNSNKMEIKTESKLLLVALSKDSALICINDDGTKAAENTIKQINEEHTNNEIRFLEPFIRNGNDANMGCIIAPTLTVHYVRVYPYTDVDEGFYFSNTILEHPSCSLLDILYMFSFSCIEEICDYFADNTLSDSTVAIMGGLSNEFFYWHDMNQALEFGAEIPSFILLANDITEEYVYNYFKDKISDFPQNNKEYFEDPLEWYIPGKESNYSIVSHKSDYLIGGYLKKVSTNVFIYISNSYHFFSPDDSFRDLEIAHSTLIELCEKLFMRYSSCLEQITSLHGRVLHILYIPEHKFTEICKKDANKYTGDIITCSTSHGITTTTIRYTISIQCLFDSLRSAMDRSFENEFFLELIKPLLTHNMELFDLISKYVQKDNCRKKTVGIYTAKQRYVYSPFSYDTEIKTGSHIYVKNLIAKICKEHKIAPGDYHGKDATTTIRTIQAYLVPYFENQLSIYDKASLHKKLLMYYSYQINGIYIHMQRYKSFTDLDEDIQQEFIQNTISFREKNRICKISSEYIIETNLYIDHATPSKSITDKAYNYLLALSYWLCDLQEVSDICYFFPNADSYISLDDKYLFSIHREDNRVEQLYRSSIQRKYKITDYWLKFDAEDELFMRKMMEAFYQDTGIRFDILTSLLEYVCKDFIHEQNLTESNYYEIEKQTIVDEYLKEALDKTITKKSITDAIDFITLDTSLLKTYGNNNQADILPIWERKKRNNRFEVKPIIERDGKCIFSPVAIYQLLDIWKNGTCNWILPYEIGMSHMKDLLSTWKKRYEDLIVHDIKLLFEKANFTKSIPNMELCSRFPKEDFPPELGDYDIFAVNEQKAEIWLIESKVLHKVASIHDDLMLQRDFFFDHKYDEKFQRRIDYITNHLEKIRQVFKLQHNSYAIIPYMVTNKLFYSRYKQLSFEILTYSELESILNNNNINN